MGANLSTVNVNDPSLTGVKGVKTEDLKTKLDNLTQVVIPENNKSNLDLMKNLVEMMSSTNNTETIMKIVEEYNQRIKNKNDPSQKQIETADLKPAMDIIKNYHTNLSTYLNSPDLANDSRNQSVNTYKAIKHLVSDKLKPLVDPLLKSDLLDDKPDIKQVVAKIFEHIENVNARSMFFEYKYISMYVFMVLFIQHVYNTMDKVIVDVIALNELRNEYKRRTTSDVINTILNKILGAVEAKGIDITADIQDHDKIINQATASLQTKLQDVETRLKSSLDLNMKELLKFILENEDGMAKDLFHVASMTNGSPTTQTSGPVTPSSSPFGSRLVGGFIRDGTTMPQAFYDLS